MTTTRQARASTTRANGTELFYELSGSGEPLVLVHGAWADHRIWDPVVGSLAESFRVLAYDRRGHSASERPAGQGSVFEDADDLAALIEKLDLAPAHIAGLSSGAAITLRAATRHPDVFRTVIAHEPPLFPLLAGTEFEPALDEVQRRVGAVVELLDSGDHESAARLFMNTIAFGPDAWETQLTPEMREVFVHNAPTFLGEARDPDLMQIDLDALAEFTKPALLTSGTDSPPFFGPVIDMLASRLPKSQRVTIEGADHVANLSRPDRYVELVTTFAQQA
ncbi:MAG: alpha/beta hydrolase [Solirubrobacteraceae bacterium]